MLLTNDTNQSLFAVMHLSTRKGFCPGQVRQCGARPHRCELWFVSFEYNKRFVVDLASSYTF